MNPEIDVFGTKRWYKDGKCHRDDGPAVILYSGDKFWFKEGKWHREDGPAVELHRGEKLWYYEGKCIDCKSQEEFERLIRLRAFW